MQQAYLRVGLELLELSWFFSSLYLWALYVSFFLAPAGTRLTTLAKQARSLGLSQKKLSALSVHPKLAVTVIPRQLASSLAGGLTSTTLLCVLWVACLAFISYAGLGFLVHVEGLFGGVTLGNMLSYY